ncbi:glycosyltransferase family 2 protein [Candidatus Woesearchaeota archaeon]|jgi:dolichyl-phosphate beta-glucosyltransferase|nr:glycosyltransferase family 2 protein [Candidatus Woesearchaeota archaeon]MBT6040980.1 glycosyltransferase family 2 protein [Candidatus Woesearchaeota archaeon]MBT6336130.1 glycosyltransferase family 2 protein [Candidatus Woesearchaeota archaeon]MBT7928075.1 glycosyltransferase family 2 protein [Candidatus Woesearchaeota archaeon]
MEISVIIPAYNEEKRIEPTLKKVINYLDNNFDKYEIIVVDDCSTDNTYKIVSRYKKNNVKILRNEINKGKGYSVKRGILNVKYSLVLFSDSDLATPIEELEKFINYIKTYDIIIASRNLKESDIKIKQPMYRQLMGKTFPLLVNLIALRGFKDTQCGFKLFKTDVAKKIVSLQTFERFSFDVEILFIAKKLRYKIKEAPVIWIDKEGSKVNPIKDSIKMLIDLFKIRYNNLLDKYRVK